MNSEVEKLGLPVHGYRAQKQDAIDAVNRNKIDEEQLLQKLDVMKGDDTVDQRWLAVARTHFEQGYMALNRSIFKPERVKV